MTDDVAVEGVFDVGLAIVGAAIEADRVVLVVREQRFPARRGVKIMRSERVGKLQVVQAGGVRFVGHERDAGFRRLAAEWKVRRRADRSRPRCCGTTDAEAGAGRRLPARG